MRRLVGLAVVVGPLLVWASASWACVAGIRMELERQFVAPGDELAVSIQTSGGAAEMPLIAIRLDQPEAAPLITVRPNPTGPTDVRVVVPPSATLGEHLLIANDVKYPPEKGRGDYLMQRALFSVVSPADASRNPTMETVFTFAPPLTYEETRSMLLEMGAELVRLHASTGDFENTPGAPVDSALADFQQRLGRPLVDTVTIRGRGEVAATSKFAGRVAERRVIDLTPAVAVTGQDDDGVALPVALVAVASVILVAAAAMIVRRRRSG